MNETIQLLTTHVSVRSFENTPLSNTIKEELIRAASSGSTSNFVQAYSIIEITDLELRHTLAELTKNIDHIQQTGAFYVFVADLHTHATLLEQKGLPTDGVETLESLLVATIDTTIAAQNMVIAAESLGLGVCYIGGMRNDLERVRQLLHLPRHTLPLFGLTIGVPVHKNDVKPRKPHKNIVSQNTYQQAQRTDLAEYDHITASYYANRGSSQQQTSWSDKMLDFFSVVRRPEVAEFIKKQGFNI